MKRSRSISKNLESTQIKKEIKKGCSFSDFQNLELKGQVVYISYGQFLSIRNETTREERQRAIKNYYYNYK